MILLLLAVATTVSAQEPKQLRDSLSSLIRQIEHNGNSVDLRLRKAALNMQLEQWDYAMEEYSNVLRMEEGNLTALRFRGYAYERLGRYDFARRDYEEFLKVIPDHFEVLLGLALLNQKDRHFTQAMDQMNRLVEMYPGNGLAYAARGGMEWERDMLDLAEYDFGEAIRLDPENADYWANRAEVRIGLGLKNEALDDLRQAVRLGIPHADLISLFNQCR